MYKNIVITHGYSDSNKGDLAITEAIVISFKKRFPNASITLLSTFRKSDPDFWYHNRMMKQQGIKIIQGVLPTPYIGSEKSFLVNIKASLRLISDTLVLNALLAVPFISKLIVTHQTHALEAIKNADIIVVKGGQFIYNDKEDLRGDLFLWRTLQPIKVASHFRKKIIILGQSIGGFATIKSERKAMKYLKLCEKIYVREKLSYELLKKYHLDNKTEIYPDFAFLISLKKKSSFNLGQKIENKNLIGVTVVNYNFPQQRDPIKAKESYKTNLIYAIEKAYKELNLFPVFIPQVTVRHHGKSDIDLILDIQKDLELKNINSLLIKEDLKVEEMLTLYSKCQLLIGTRLHSCILAANASTPVIAIRYQGFKTQGVMKMLGFENLVFDINDLNGNELWLSIQNVYKNKEFIQSKIENQVNTMKLQLNELVDNL